MSHPLARRTGTVGALVAAVSVTMVAGIWPALGVAAAAEQGVPKIDSGSEQAPGQLRKEPAPVAPVVAPEPAPAVVADPVVVAGAPVVVADAPVAAPVADAPRATPPGQAKKEAAVADPVTALVTAAPVVGPSTTDLAPVADATTAVAPGADTSGTIAAPAPAPAKADAPVKAKKTTATVDPAAAPASAPAPAPVVDVTDATPGKDSADKKGRGAGAPVVGPPTGLAAPPASDRDHAPVEKSRAQVAAAAPAAAPRPVRVGPVVPVLPVVAVPKPAAQPVAVALGPGSREIDAPAQRTFVPSAAARIAAADVMPLRPQGATSRVVTASSSTSAQAATRSSRDQEGLTGDLTSALPGVAAGTAEAVADTPGIPLGIAAVVVLFLLVQNRIDRRDPKLALARIEDDEPLEFTPRAEVVHLRLLQAA